MVIISTTTVVPNAATPVAAAPQAPQSPQSPRQSLTPSTAPTAAAFASTDSALHTAHTAPTPTATDIVTLAEKMHICEYYAALNKAPSTVTFNNLCTTMRLDTDNCPVPTSPAASPVTPLSPPSTPPCTPANPVNPPPPTWHPATDTADAQIATALNSVSFNGVKPTSVAHLLHLRSLQTADLQNANVSEQQREQLYDHYQQQYITALEATRTKLREALRSRIRDAIKLRCVKPQSFRKRSSSSPASRAVNASNTTKSLANATAAAAAAAARATNAAHVAPLSVSSVSPDMSIEDRVHRLFRAHRFMLRESEKILAHMRVAYDSNISPIVSDDDMDDEHDAGNGGAGGAGNGVGNRAILNVAN